MPGWADVQVEFDMGSKVALAAERHKAWAMKQQQIRTDNEKKRKLAVQLRQSKRGRLDAELSKMQE